MDVLSHYSEKTMACKRCGFDDLRALSIDHVHGDGYLWRKKNTHGASGTRLYQWLKRSNYPDGFQVLCMNCQFIKRRENNEEKKVARHSLAEG